MGSVALTKALADLNLRRGRKAFQRGGRHLRGSPQSNADGAHHIGGRPAHEAPSRCPAQGHRIPLEPDRGAARYGAHRSFGQVIL